MEKQDAIAIYVYGTAIILPCLFIGIFAPAMAFIPLLMLTAGLVATLAVVALVRHYDK